jgi:small GTP-binding protein
MIRKKICLLGTSGVGKTSLTARFMERPFSERYLTTIGVRVDRKMLEVSEREILLLIWDLAGEDRFQRVHPAYLRGSAGYLLVADGTRGGTLDRALSLHEWARTQVGPVPFSLLLNKSDLESQWELDPSALSRLESEGWRIIRTSALTGAGVDSALRTLATDMLAR